MPEKMRKHACAAVSALLAIAMTCAFTSVSIAEEPTTPTTGDSAATTTQTQQTDQQADAQQSETAENQSDADNGNASVSTAADGVCEASTWADIAQCVQDAETGSPTAITIADGVTTIEADQSIAVDNKQITLTVPQDVTIHQAAGFASSMFTFKGNDDSGKLTLNGEGTFQGCRATTDADDKVTFSDGTCTDDNSKTFGSVVYMESGELQIDGNLTFEGFRANNGGVINAPAKDDTASTTAVPNTTITINNGTFRNNVVYAGHRYPDAGSRPHTTPGQLNLATNIGNGGGVIYAAGKVIVNGGTFDHNVAQVQGKEGSAAVYNEYFNGGGAIYLNAGNLFLNGGVFSNNTAHGTGHHAGGGAIWSAGNITVDGAVFTNNYAQGDNMGISGGGAIYISSGAMGSPNTARALLTVLRGTFVHNMTRGDGGAIFLGWYATAVFTGDAKTAAPEVTATNLSGLEETTKPTTAIWFADDHAEHLGGAVYTEEDSLTYMDKAVAYGNHAGHFGGGLWLCPSGRGYTSKGGNMMLFNNGVDKQYDVQQTQTVTGTSATYPTNRAGGDSQN